MVFFQGQSLSGGLATGTAVVLEFEIHPKFAFKDRRESDSILQTHVESECERMDEALDISRKELLTLGSTISKSTALGATVDIFNVHASLAREISESVKTLIANDLLSVETALENVIDQWISRLALLDNAYFRERTVDIRDIGQRLKRQLQPVVGTGPQEYPTGTVIVARELMPSDAMALAGRGIAAIVTELGSKLGHTAIIARALGIPAITGIINVVAKIGSGETVLVDGDAGRVVVRPTIRALTEFRMRLAEAVTEEDAAVDLSRILPCSTADGVMITLRGNVGMQVEAEQIRRFGLDGIGLLRTEFLFLTSQVRPDTESQRLIYSQIAESLKGLPLVIRTFDFGSEKLPPFLALDSEVDPLYMSVRGLAFSLAEGALLRDQIEAIVHVAQQADVRILLPMVISGSDLSQVISIMDEVLNLFEGMIRPPLGAMIETPAALFCLDEILELVDFITIGTNDLSHYMLAANREFSGTNDQITAMHPAVLRAIAQVANSAQQHDCPLCVCGEEAGEPEFAQLLIGLGIRELSISPAKSKSIRSAIAGIDTKAASELAARALQCQSPNEVRELCALSSSSVHPVEQAELSEACL